MTAAPYRMGLAHGCANGNPLADFRERGKVTSFPGDMKKCMEALFHPSS
jgi:hypothetical protein